MNKLTKERLDELQSALADMREARESHQYWVDNPAVADILETELHASGDVTYNREWVEKYDRVIGLLEGVERLESELAICRGKQWSSNPEEVGHIAHLAIQSQTISRLRADLARVTEELKHAETCYDTLSDVRDEIEVRLKVSEEQRDKLRDSIG